MKFLSNDIGYNLFNEDSVSSIIGGSKKFKKMYEFGKFNIGMSVLAGHYNDVHDTIRCVGCKSKKPLVLSKLYQHMANLKGGNYFNYMSIKQIERGSFLLLFRCSRNGYARCCEFIVKELGNGRYSYEESVEASIAESGGSFVEYCGNDIEFSRLFYDSLEYCINLSPEPVYSIDYVIEYGVSNPKDIGVGSDYFIGFCEAIGENIGYFDVMGYEDCKGEYAIVFMETR